LPFMKENILRLPEHGLSIAKNEMTISEVGEGDWATAWKKYYHPVRLTRFLTIVPSWKAYDAQDEGEKIMTLHPGMAYGTG
ncbi:50S ribosomal protein L11 methyltransferase, partial [Enterococcus faecalis]|uniref:50S ribosomal protein L11 methyltransferase n=1 Tax=Enterococcus faecalis TaxID=1351 RepID=UPI003D6BF1D0